MRGRKKFKYIYGPVYSWRLGRSLGVDLLSKKRKICTFGCKYCQLGKTRIYTTRRCLFVATKKVIEEIRNLPKVGIDYITFSGTGEPTLAKNLGEVIKRIKKIRPEPIAVLTNSSLITRDDVRSDLIAADLVSCKIDALSQETFTLINKPYRGMRFESIFKGIKKFRKVYKKKLALQIMFTKMNKDKAPAIARLAREIKPDEIQINTPLRPPTAGRLTKSEILNIKKYFRGLKTISIYETMHKRIKPVSAYQTKRRRGCYG